MLNTEYKSVAEHLYKNSSFAQENAVALALINGGSLAGIVPIGITEAETTLCLKYIDQQSKLSEIPITEVNGLRVSQGLPNTPLAGQFLVEFNYYSPRDGGKMEEVARKVRVTGINFGVQINHANAGEIKPDYYFIGYDQQYLTKGGQLEASVRQFPLWRIGAYGQVLAHMSKFMKVKS